MVMTIFMSTEDGVESVTTQVKGPKEDAVEIARTAYQALEREGGAALVAAARANQR